MKTYCIIKRFIKRFSRVFHLMRSNERPSKGSTKNLIIKCRILPHKVTVMTDDLYGFTKTKIMIEEVYDGQCGKETVLEIYEPYYERYYHGKKSLFVCEEYEPLKLGCEYILKLVKDEAYNLYFPQKRILPGSKEKDCLNKLIYL